MILVQVEQDTGLGGTGYWFSEDMILDQVEQDNGSGWK